MNSIRLSLTSTQYGFAARELRNISVVSNHHSITTFSNQSNTLLGGKIENCRAISARSYQYTCNEQTNYSNEEYLNRELHGKMLKKGIAKHIWSVSKIDPTRLSGIWQCKKKAKFKFMFPERERTEVIQTIPIYQISNKDEIKRHSRDLDRDRWLGRVVTCSQEPTNDFLPKKRKLIPKFPFIKNTTVYETALIEDEEPEIESSAENVMFHADDEEGELDHDKGEPDDEEFFIQSSKSPNRRSKPTPIIIELEMSNSVKSENSNSSNRDPGINVLMY